MPKIVEHGIGDHVIHLEEDGIWRVYEAGYLHRELFESTDCEICMEAIDEVEAEYLAEGNDDA
jgi:hypothetical protein